MQASDLICCNLSICTTSGTLYAGADVRAASGKLYAGPESSAGFLVEDIERCQADVSDFRLIESDFFVQHS
jgi:hypothetical protein